MFEKIFERWPGMVLLDTETTGLEPGNCQIIELAALRLEPDGEGGVRTAGQMDALIRLPEGERLPERIVELTHITDAMLEAEGIEPDRAAADFRALAGEGPVLIASYNAAFDLAFLRELLRGQPPMQAEFLDVLTVYKDRRAYPHRLQNAIEAYGLTERVQNSHRAIDDVLAMAAVMEEMERERDDLADYAGAFGFNPKYGPPKTRIRGVRYYPQRFRQEMAAPSATLATVHRMALAGKGITTFITSAERRCGGRRADV